VAENQGDGTIKNRTFKLVITKSLEVQNTNGTWAAKTLQSKLNIIGEYQYYLTAPISGTVTQTSRQLSPAVATSLNRNNGNTLVSSNGRFTLTYITSPVPPPPPPNYPNPIPNPVNNLVADKEYRFIVTATLMESVVAPGVGRGDGTATVLSWVWVPAKTRAGVAVSETKTVLFRTGGMPLAQVNTTVPRSR